MTGVFPKSVHEMNKEQEERRLNPPGSEFHGVWLQHSDIEAAKRDRFAKELISFRSTYEKPVIDAFKEVDNQVEAEYRAKRFEERKKKKDEEHKQGRKKKKSVEPAKPAVQEETPTEQPTATPIVSITEEPAPEPKKPEVVETPKKRRGRKPKTPTKTPPPPQSPKSPKEQDQETEKDQENEQQRGLFSNYQNLFGCVKQCS